MFCNCSFPKTDVTLSVVVCGDRIQETLVMIKSAIIFSKRCNLRVIVITETDLLQHFEEKVLRFFMFGVCLLRFLKTE